MNTPPVDLPTHASTADGSPQQAPTANAPLRYSLVVPVFNEGANIGTYLRTARETLGADGYELLVCYDFDADNTLPAIAATPDTEKPAHVRLVRNDLGKGVRYAIEAGFKAATTPVVIVSMADLSDDLAAIPKMLVKMDAGAVVVSGSRYMRGGRQIGGPWFKGFLSRAAGSTLRWFTGLPTYDATNSFRAYRRDFLEATPIESTAGFCLGLELTVKAHFHGHRVDEVPSTWQDRVAGESRFQLLKWLPHYLQWYLWAFRARWFGVDTNRGSRSLPTIIALSLLFVLGFCARYASIEAFGHTDYLTWANRNYFGGITTGYLRQAQAPHRAHVYPPGFPSLIRVVGRVSNAATDDELLQTIRLTQAALDSLGIVALFIVLRRVQCDTTSALIGSAGYAFIPALVFGATIPLAEWFNPLCLLLILATWPHPDEAGDKAHQLPTAICGILLAMWTAFRPETVVALPVLVSASLLVNARPGLVHLATLAIAFFTTVGLVAFATQPSTPTNEPRPSAMWYALWAGLGDISNDLGYWCDDTKTGEHLQSLGLVYHSPQAERYFRDQYFRAWQVHPWHVLQCVGYRCASIVLWPDFIWAHIDGGHHLVWLARLVVVGRISLIPIVVLMLARERSAIRMTILSPILIAFLSIGLIHYEPRYVRYVELSILLALPLFLDRFLGINISSPNYSRHDFLTSQ